MKVLTQKFVTWLMGLTRMMRYFVIAVLFHVLLLVVLGSIKIVAILPKIVASFESGALPPAKEAEPDPFAAYGQVDYNGPTLGGGGGTPGKGPGGVPTAAGQTPTQYKAGIESESHQAQTDAGQVIGVVDDSAVASAVRFAGNPGGLSAPTEGLGEADVGTAGVRGPGGGGFGQRQGPRRMQNLNRFGGSRATERAVLAALRWLKANQRSDGSWKCAQSDRAGTALAVLAFLGHGETTDSPEFGPTVQKGLQYLVTSVGQDGMVVDRNMYAQGMVSLALSEAYGMTQSPAVKDPLDRAVRAITRIQKVKKKDAKYVGGWRYSATSDDSDTSVSGWMIMALKSARLAGENVPQDAFDSAAGYLWQMYGDGGFGYQNPGKDLGPTAIGVLCEQFLGHSGDPRIKKSLDFLRGQRAEWSSTKAAYVLYDWYYITQAMFQGGGSYWEYWNSQIRDTMVSSQSDDGHWALPPQSEWEGKLVGNNSPVYSTALGALILEVYYRYLPIYQELEKHPGETAAAGG